MYPRNANPEGSADELWTSAGTDHDRVPAPGEVDVPAGLSYLHYTTNNTIYGTQYPEIPEAGDVPLVADMSSDVFGAPLDVDWGMIWSRS